MDARMRCQGPIHFRDPRGERSLGNHDEVLFNIINVGEADLQHGCHGSIDAMEAFSPDRSVGHGDWYRLGHPQLSAGISSARPANDHDPDGQRATTSGWKYASLSAGDVRLGNISS